MDKERYIELMGFFYALLSRTDDKALDYFRKFITQTGFDELRIRRAKIKTDSFKEVLTNIDYNTRLKRLIEDSEPPDHVKRHIGGIVQAVWDKAHEYFKSAAHGAIEFSRRNGRTFIIEAERGLFGPDNRVMLSVSNTYKLEFSCYYCKESQRLDISFSARFNVLESAIATMDSDNFTLFDPLAHYLGLKNFSKSVQFDALYSEGEIFYNNNCEVCWSQSSKIE